MATADTAPLLPAQPDIQSSTDKPDDVVNEDYTQIDDDDGVAGDQQEESWQWLSLL